MTLGFLVIGSYLAWRVGDRSQVRVGENKIMGCGRYIFLLDEIIKHLQVIGICTLNLIGIPNDTYLCSQGWRKERWI
jgi:hypothetical protein